MKKILVLMLGILLLGSIVVADPVTKQFTVSTNVTGRLELKVSTQPVIAVSAWGEVVDLTGNNFTTSAAANFYLHILNNQKVAIRVNITAPSMSTTDSTYTIPYSVASGSTTITSAATATETSLAVVAASSAGLRVDAIPFTITPDSVKFQEASAGSYSATLTFLVYAP